MQKWAQMVYKASQKSFDHDKTLRPMVGVVLATPIWTFSFLAWTLNVKKDVKIIRYGNHEKWNTINPTLPTQMGFCQRSHRAAYRRDPVVDKVRDEIYCFDAFKKPRCQLYFK